MKKVILTIIAAVSLFSCSPESQSETTGLEGTFLQSKKTEYYLNEPHRGEDVFVYPEGWDRTITITKEETSNGFAWRSVSSNGWNMLYIPEGSDQYTDGGFNKYEILLTQNTLTIENVTQEDTGTKRTIMYYERL